MAKNGLPSPPHQRQTPSSGRPTTSPGPQTMPNNMTISLRGKCSRFKNREQGEGNSTTRMTCPLAQRQVGTRTRSITVNSMSWLCKRMVEVPTLRKSSSYK